MKVNTHSTYYPEIDGLKGLAIIVIMFFHAYPHIFPGGFIAVDLFFLLSGLLLASSFIRKINNSQNLSLANYYKKKALQLLPSIIVLVIGFYIMTRIQTSFDQLTIKEAIAALLFLTNWPRAFEIFSTHFTGHLWYVAILAQYFLIAPLVLFPILKTKQWKKILLGLSVVVVVIFLWKIFLLQSGTSIIYIYQATEMKLDIFILGIILGIITTKFPDLLNHFAKHRILIPTLNIVILVTLFLFILTVDYIFREIYYYILPSIVFMLTFIIIQVFTVGKTMLKKVLKNKVLLYFGITSYSMYIWHYPIVDRYESAFPLIILAVPTSILMYYVIEKPLSNSNITSLRERFL